MIEKSKSSITVLFYLFTLAIGNFTFEASHAFSDPLFEKFKRFSEGYNFSSLKDMPVQNQGRLKPFYTYARETSLYLTGKYSPGGVSPLPFYFALIAFPESEKLRLINVRNVDLREKLGLPRERKHFSLAELGSSPLQSMAQPLLKKQQKNSRSLRPAEKDTLEAWNQLQFFSYIRSGHHFMDVTKFTNSDGADNRREAASVEDKSIAVRQFVDALRSHDKGGAASRVGPLKKAVIDQPTIPVLEQQKARMGLEVAYIRVHIFIWAAVLYILLALALVSRRARNWLLPNKFFYLSLIPLALVGSGLVWRVLITGFAPVTNMYGTMIWVAFGVGFFGLVLFKLYHHFQIVASIWVGVALLLILTENMPLILSPDMDPIVAVLRSNFWLTTHVLTITISYAAFTIAMILGNIAIARFLFFKRLKGKSLKEYSHSAYRMIQLGVFLLSVGIILGGIWADYSWGRFWGWDPKETWALIAALGYLAILHGRFVGWVGTFELLLYSPLAYLLVIMAWYGVNFILATGLHSYGFSSGGAMAVALFAGVQALLVAAAFTKRQLEKRSRTLSTADKTDA